MYFLEFWDFPSWPSWKFALFLSFLRYSACWIPCFHFYFFLVYTLLEYTSYRTFLRRVYYIFNFWDVFRLFFLLASPTIFHSFCCCLVAMTLCNAMNSMPGFLILHWLRKFAQTHVHWVGDAIQSSHPLSPLFSCLQSFPASGSFPMSWLFATGGQNIWVLASAPVLPVNIQSWFPLGLTGLVSLQSKWLSRVFFSTTIWKH